MERLQHLTELAIRSHNWTSFSPEKRGESLVKEHEAELDEDLKTIEEICKEFGSPKRSAAIVTGMDIR